MGIVLLLKMVIDQAMRLINSTGWFFYVLCLAVTGLTVDYFFLEVNSGLLMVWRAIRLCNDGY
jgi:hypothetical protein